MTFKAAIHPIQAIQAIHSSHSFKPFIQAIQAIQAIHSFMQATAAASEPGAYALGYSRTTVQRY